MIFKEGDLHEKCEMYRRQLGGVSAANNRLKERIKSLEAAVAIERDAHHRWRARAFARQGRVNELEKLVDSLAKKVAWPIKEGMRMPPDFEELKAAMEELGLWKEPRDGK